MKNYLLSCIYLTRRCPMKCEYCAIRDNKLRSSELNLEEWKRAFLNLEKLGCDFHLILGNEVLELGNDLVELVKFFNKENISYAMYSTCPEPSFTELKDKLMNAGLKNLSFGFDTMIGNDSIAIKSRRGLKGIKELKKKGLSDYQGTITLSNRNIDEIEDLLKLLTDAGLWGAVNTIHWNKDGKYDFFPKKEEIKKYILKDKKKVKKVIERIKEKTLSGEYKIQNPPEYFDALAEYAYDMSWHCSLPIVITVDSDGSLRLCGYRKGNEITKFNILDIDSEEKLNQVFECWEKESKECPGCFWSYWFMAEWYAKTNDINFGKELFQKHASKYY